MNNVKRSFLTSLISLVLCLTMFLGTTFAWFTDIVVSGGNIIQSGKLDAEMYWSDEYLASTDSGWTQVKDNKPIFTYDNWEPGYTEIKYIKVANAGNLNFKWKLSIEAEGKVTDLSDVIDVYYVNPVNGELTKQALAARTPDGKLTDVLANKTATEGDQLTPGGSVVLAIAFHMDELAGNEYQKKSLCDKGFSLKLLATQATGENDSFDDQYDKESEWPEIPSAGNNASADVPTDTNGVVTTATTITGNGMSATVPAGTQLTQGTNKLTLSVNNVEDSKANVTLAEGEELRALDVHIYGVAEGNTTPIAVTLTEALPKGLNIGNYTLHHVEDGQTVPMNLLADGATPVHNDFTYDPVTGDVVLYLKSFSEFALVAEPAKWEGNRDYSWYTNAVAPVDGEAVTEYIIANADQLAAFSAIVGGMAKKDSEGIIYTSTGVDEKATVVQDSFAGKTVKLIADIKICDTNEYYGDASENGIVFYPIGYWNSDEDYVKHHTGVSSGFYTFSGTFDGNGHTISDFYQNTWEMKGDHNWYDAKDEYYRDGMGLFGRVYKGTVKNLTVKNFSSDGEIATTGVIAAYADGATFENIAIFDCNPRVYNIGNGGIVGCVGWYAKEAELKTTFKNITVDNSNKISALWGSYDVACGGIVGQYYPTSGQSSYEYPVNGGIDFVNCHISAVMDVYNDVCANYQYYAYRYTGMLIGSVRENETIDGHSYPKMDKITASGCTVHFGDWNDYYYCEIVANTTASYTHDHQFSRLTQVASVDATNKTVVTLDGKEQKISESGWAHYVVVKNKDNTTGKWIHGDGEKYATCYHFNNGQVWNHEDAGYHNGENGEKFIDENGDGIADLKEDKQLVYLEFNNLVTGYGWGVTSRGFANLDGVTNLDIAQGDQESSVEKFEAIGNINTYRPGQPIRVGDLFTANDGVNISGNSVYVSVSAVVDGEVVSATFALDAKDWRNSTITFSADSVANAKVTITDYIFCNPTEIVLTKENEAPKFTANSVSEKDAYDKVVLGDLFNAIDGASIGDVIVTITSPDGTYTINATNSDWTTKEINLNKSGSWTISIKDKDDYCTETAVTFTVNNINKFSANSVGAQNAYTQITLGDLFNAIVDDSKIGTVTATVVAPNNPPTTITGTSADWGSKTIDLVKDGEWTVKITDNASCIEAGIKFNVNKVDKFTKKFDKNFLYRVGNLNEFAIGYIFGEIATEVMLSSVNVSIDNVKGNATGTFTPKATWTNGTLKFEGTGVVKVTIIADGANPVELYLEVVDAQNATSAVGTTTGGNFVLLCDVNTSSFQYLWDCKLYGNGFVYSLKGAPTKYSSGHGHGVLVTKNATLDNLVIVGDEYTEYGALSTDNYYTSAIDVTGNTIIQNCYISGCSAPVRARSNVTIVNSTLYGGAVANLIIQSGTVTLTDVTTANYDDGRALVGMGIVVHSSASDNAKLVLNGTLTQYNFMSESKVPNNSYAKNLHTAMFDSSCSQYHFGTSPNRYVNTGIISMTSTFTREDIEDNANTGYTGKVVTISGVEGTGYVFTQPNTIGNVNNNYEKENDPYYAKVQGVVAPDVVPDYTQKNYLNKTEGSNDYCYEDSGTVYISMDYGDTFSWDTSILTITKIDNTLNYTVSMNGTDYTGKSITFNTSGDYAVIYTYVDPYNHKLDNNGNVTTYDYTHTYVVNITVSVIKPTTQHASFTFGSDGQATEKITVNNNTYISAVDVTANGKKWGSMDVGGTKIYFPIVEAEIVQTKAGNIITKEAEVQAHFYVFNGVVTITDYENAGTGNKVVYDGETKENPAGLSVVKGSYGGFVEGWYNNSDAKLTTPQSGQSPLKVFCYAGSGEGSLSEYNGKLCYSSQSDLSTKNRGEYYTLAQFVYQDNAGATYYYYVGYHMQNSKNVAPDYSSGGTCIAEGSMITLADGSKKAVEDLRKGDVVMAFDHITGKVVYRTINIVGKTYADSYYRNVFIFDDGTELNAINEHGIYDLDLNMYVNIGELNYHEYIGHRFVSIDACGNIGVKLLVDVVSTVESGYKYDIVTNETLNYVVEDTLSVSHELVTIMNSFAFDDNMVYDAEAMNADIAEYGLYTYEDFAQYCEREVFEQYNMAMMKVGVGKGLYTYEHLVYLLTEIALNDDVQIID